MDCRVGPLGLLAMTNRVFAVIASEQSERGNPVRISSHFWTNSAKSNTKLHKKL
jgi:hypothetical protein